MKGNDYRGALVGIGLTALVGLLAVPMRATDVYAAGTGTTGGLTNANSAQQQEEDLPINAVTLQTNEEIQEKLKAIDEYQKLISSKEMDWYAGGGSWSDPSYKLMIPTDELTYQIIFIGEDGYPALFLDNAGYGTHADGYQELMLYSGGKMNVLVSDDTLQFYQKAGIVVGQHFGGGYGEVSRHYWKIDVKKGDALLIAQEYHLTPEANIMEYDQEDIDAMVKNGATAGEYMDVYDSPVKVDVNFEWSSKKNLKELTTRSEIIKAFRTYFNDYGEYESFKKAMKIFAK